MKLRTLIALFALIVITFIAFRQMGLGKVPIPTDALVGLYHPYRDLYAKEYPRGFPYKNPLITDPVLQQIPWRELSLSALSKFQFPLWNPYSFAGYPLLGNVQSAPFYPLNIVFLLLPFQIGWSFVIVLQPLLAGVFMFLYLRRRLSDAASFLGGLAFSFSGFFVSWNEWGTIASTGLWLPLILLAIDGVIQERQKYRFGALLFFTILASYLAGHLQTFFYVFLVSTLYALFRLQSNKWNNWIWLTGVGLIFVILSLPVWHAQLQLILLSARDVDLTWQKEGWFLPIQHLVQFIAPDFFGNPATGNYWGVWNYGEFLGYVGIFPLLFAFFGVQKKNKVTLFFSGLVLVALLFAIENPISRLPYLLQFPFLSSTQPTRLLFVIDFSLSVLAAFGVERVIKTRKSNLVLPLSIIAFTFVFIGILFTQHQLFSISENNWIVAQHNLILPALLLLTALGFFLSLFFIQEKYRKIALLGVLALTVCDLLFVTNKYNAFSNVSFFYPSTKVLTFLQQNTGNQRVMAVDRRVLPANMSSIYRIQNVSGYDPLYIRRYGELIAAMQRNKPDISTPFGFQRIITPDKYDSRITDLLGVKYVLSLTDIKSPKLRKVFEEGETRVYENKGVYPRAFFAEKVVKADSKQQAISLLFDPTVDLRNTAIVEGVEDQFATSFLKGKVVLKLYSDNVITYQTENEVESFLVLTDIYYPSWHLTLDGKSWPILLTDYTFRGVVVPKGTHELQFKSSLF